MENIEYKIHEKIMDSWNIKSEIRCVECKQVVKYPVEKH